MEETLGVGAILFEYVVLMVIGLVFIVGALGVAYFAVDGPAHLLHEWAIVCKHDRATQIRRYHTRIASAVVMKMILVMGRVKVL